MDPFLTRAAIGGLGVAMAAAPIGCFVLWRRLAYFGAAVSHAALLGVALGLVFGLNPMIGVFATGFAVAALLAGLEGRADLPTDSLIGILAHGALAAGVVVVSSLHTVRVDLMGYLFGDVLAIQWRDIALIYGFGTAALGALFWVWRDLLSLTIHRDLAAVDGVKTDRIRLVFMLLVAAVVAIGLQVVGILMIISLLIIPAASARAFAATPESMAAIAVGIAAASVIGGLALSFAIDSAAGPTIVLTASLIFALSLPLGRLWQRRNLAGRTAHPN